MFNTGWIKAVAALTGLGLIIIGTAALCLGADLILGILTILAGVMLGVDPLGNGGS